MNIWFTSDLHLGHANIIKYCERTLFMSKQEIETYRLLGGMTQEEQRRFKISDISVNRMNKILIKNYNERVKNKDVVFHIGDFCFKGTKGSKQGEGQLTKATIYEDKLNGKIIFLKGNHDKNNSCKTMIERIGIIIGGNRINLVHNPEFADVNYDINFCGHVHNHWKFKRIRFGYSFTDIVNVGVDVWDFRPVSYNEIMHTYNKWLKQNKFEHTKVSF